MANFIPLFNTLKSEFQLYDRWIPTIQNYEDNEKISGCQERDE